MKNEQEISETIKAYLAKTLSAEESKAFEARLDREPELKKALEDEKFFSNLLLEKELFELRDQMKTDFEISDKSRFFKLKVIGTIATIAVVCTALFFVLPKTTIKDTSEIQIDPAIDAILLVDEVESKTPLISIEKTYSKQDSPKEPTISSVENKAVVSENQAIAKNIEESPKSAIVLEKPIQTIEKQVDVVSKPCEEKIIEAIIQPKPSEKNQQNGSIVIQLTKDKSSNYVYSLQKENEFSEKTNFEHLAKGNYQVFAKSNDGCIHLLGQTVVKETFCLNEYKKSFSPEFDPAWVVPLFENEPAKIVIKDKAGATFLETHSFSNNEISWDGNMSTGGAAPTGSYKVFITYQNGEYCIATVSLFR